MENYESPLVKLKVKNESVAFDDWCKIRQLEAFRLALGDGFGAHLHQNPIIQAKFEFTDIAAKGMTRRMYDTEVSKSRDKERKNLRRDKHYN